MPSNQGELRLTDRKRLAIIDGAARAFERHGFDGASMDRIAETAKVTKRTIYRHFGSKEELFNAIVKELLAKTAKWDKVDYHPSRSLEEQLSAIGHECVDFLMSENVVRLLRVVVSRFMQCPELAAEVALEEETKQQLAQWIKAAKKDGRLSARSPMRAAREFTAILEGFALWPQVLGGRRPLSKRKRNQVVEAATKMFLGHYATPELPCDSR